MLKSMLNQEGSKKMSQKQNEPDRFFDARGLICPMPVLRARKILLSMSVGEVLEIHVTDRSAPHDFKEFCADMGHNFLTERKISNTVTSLSVSVGTPEFDPL